MIPEARLDGVIRFHPIFKQVMWGGDRIAALKGVHPPFPDLGESWEVSAIPGRESVVVGGPYDGMSISELVAKFGTAFTGTDVNPEQPFPLLVKFIDAHHDLSLQVHPTDDIARKRHSAPGKTEMWYILEAAEGAMIYNGLHPYVTMDEFISHLQDGTVMDTVATYPSEIGQFYYLPAGTLHAIGAGNVVVEVQQTSDVTYRVYDYNRRDDDGCTRPLHITQALEAMNFDGGDVPAPAGTIFTGTHPGVVHCPYFKVDYIEVSGSKDYPLNHDRRSFSIVVCVEGEITLRWFGGETKIARGHTVVVPAVLTDIRVGGIGKALAIRV